MKRRRCFTCLFALLTASMGFAEKSYAEMVLTAEAYETPGLPGYMTYDISATVEDGYFNAFDFYSDLDGRSGGISGPLHQQSMLEGGGIYSHSPTDSGFLVNQSAGLQLFTTESNSSVNGVFAYTGIGGERASYRSWKFARVVTKAPSEVELLGQLLYEQTYNDGTSGDLVTLDLDTLLSDVTIGPAPTLGDFPDAPIIEPPVVTPPVIPDPPAPDPPVVQPPVIPDPPAPEPPVEITPPAPPEEAPLVEPDPSGNGSAELADPESPIRTMPYPGNENIAVWRPGYQIPLVETPDLINPDGGAAPPPEFLTIDELIANGSITVAPDGLPSFVLFNSGMCYACDGATTNGITTSGAYYANGAALNVQIPEPASATLLALACLTLAPLRRRLPLANPAGGVVANDFRQ